MPQINIGDATGIQVIHSSTLEYVNFYISTLTNRRRDGTMKIRIPYSEYIWNYCSFWMQNAGLSPQRSITIDDGEYRDWSFQDCIITGLESNQIFSGNHTEYEIILYISFNSYTAPYISNALPEIFTSETSVLVCDNNAPQWVSVNPVYNGNEYAGFYKKRDEVTDSFKKILNNLIDNL